MLSRTNEDAEVLVAPTTFEPGMVLREKENALRSNRENTTPPLIRSPAVGVLSVVIVLLIKFIWLPDPIVTEPEVRKAVAYALSPVDVIVFDSMENSEPCFTSTVDAEKSMPIVDPGFRRDEVMVSSVESRITKRLRPRSVREVECPATPYVEASKVPRVEMLTVLMTKALPLKIEKVVDLSMTPVASKSASDAVLVMVMLEDPMVITERAETVMAELDPKKIPRPYPFVVSKNVLETSDRLDRKSSRIVEGAK